MKQAGMTYIILQSITDFDFDTGKDLGENFSLYPLQGRICLYPSELPELAGANTGTDSVKNCLAACKELDMQAIIGPISDNRWWKYGGEIPACPAGSTDPVKESYFTRWAEENADLSNRIADEVMALYGDEYGEQIFCWYYNNEIWNIHKACKRQDKGIYAKILAESMNLSLRHYSAMQTNKPLMLSSFVNPLLSTPDELSSMWKDIFAQTEFRCGDIFAPQDSFGVHPNQDLEAWTRCYYEAVATKPGLVFWSNNECFRGEGRVAPVEDFVYQIRTTAKYCKANICFSWNHYYSPTEKNPGYHEAFTAYNTTGKLKTVVWDKPSVTVSGKQVTVDTADNSCVRGIRIYELSCTEPLFTQDCHDDGSHFFTLTLDKAGTYFAQTVDFYGNLSEKTTFSVS